MQKVLLTGATGFLGSHLAHQFVSDGCEVIILKQSTSNLKRLKSVHHLLKMYDLDQTSFDEVFQENSGIDVILHTATNYGRHNEIAPITFNANTVFPLQLLESACSYGVPTFINSDTVLPRFINDYTLSKAHFREWGLHFARQRRIRFVNVRLEHMYGPCDDETKFTTWVIHSCINNIPELKLTSGEQKRDFIYIDDVVSAFKLLTKKANIRPEMYQEFDVGSGKTITIREFVETVKKVTKANTLLQFGAVPSRQDEPCSINIDHSELLKLGWECNITLQEGIKKLIYEERRQ